MRESALLSRCTKTRGLTHNLPPSYIRKGILIMANKCLGLGLISIALPLFDSLTRICLWQGGTLVTIQGRPQQATRTPSKNGTFKFVRRLRSETQ